MDVFDVVARANLEYVESLYREYQRDPRGVDPEWARVFRDHDGDGVPGQAAEAGDLRHSYRELGHLVADLDPLGQSPREHPLVPPGDASQAELVAALRDT